MFFINNPSLRKVEAFMQEVPNFLPKGVKVDFDKLEDEILLFEVEFVSFDSRFQALGCSQRLCGKGKLFLRAFI